ncbi:MAG TPA: hypothetical protein VF820_07380 [Patescibacteria group bacterium]
MKLQYKPNWKKGEIIRHIMTGKPLLVVHIYALDINNTITLALDVENRCDPTPVCFVQQRDYSSWVTDRDLEIKMKDDILEFDYHPVKL